MAIAGDNIRIQLTVADARVTGVAIAGRNTGTASAALSGQPALTLPARAGVFIKRFLPPALAYRITAGQG